MNKYSYYQNNIILQMQNKGSFLNEQKDVTHFTGTCERNFCVCIYMEFCLILFYCQNYQY